jgi:hypothetical protein
VETARRASGQWGNLARDHIWPASGIAALCGLIAGYAAAGWFT